MTCSPLGYSIFAILPPFVSFFGFRSLTFTFVFLPFDFFAATSNLLDAAIGFSLVQHNRIKPISNTI